MVRLTICLIAALCILPIRLFAKEKPIQVFILAGQSNMVGSGLVDADETRNGGKGSLNHYVDSATASDRAKRLKDREGNWSVRNDVVIDYLDRRGKLSVGYGSDSQRIGPELGFGQVIGDAIDEPVLLIKLAWGGKSLAVDFRPPSSGGEVGPYYLQLIQQTRQILGHFGETFPELKGRNYQLAGMGWHQGWNDRVDQSFNDQYEVNLANFIRDVRKDLALETLPFVVAETGMSGPDETHPRALSIMKAQAAVATYPEFTGNVAFVSTKLMWRDASVSPSGQAYHWNNNAETYYLIGAAMGDAMLDLIRLRAVNEK